MDFENVGLEIRQAAPTTGEKVPINTNFSQKVVHCIHTRELSFSFARSLARARSLSLANKFNIFVSQIRFKITRERERERERERCKFVKHSI